MCAFIGDRFYQIPVLAGEDQPQICLTDKELDLVSHGSCPVSFFQQKSVFTHKDKVSKIQQGMSHDYTIKFLAKRRAEEQSSEVLHEETGLYYYGARYLDPRTSRWLSVDPAVSEYVPQAGKGSDGLPGMGGIFNYVNFHVYHYAGNNPIKFIDPDGRLNKNEIERRDKLFSDLISSVESWARGFRIDQTAREQGFYIFMESTLSDFGKVLLNSIGRGQACAGGAINLRNEYRDNKIPVNGWAIDLINSNDISYIRDSFGNIEKDPLILFNKLEIGDLLLYKNDNNSDGIRGSGWTGHIATIIGKEGDFLITAEYHMEGKPPTINMLHKNTLMLMNDTNLYGGAKWND